MEATKKYYCVIKLKLRNIRLRLIALWWFLTRSHYYLFSTNHPGTFGRSMTSTNLVIPEMLEYIKRQHGYLDHRELIVKLQNVRRIDDSKERMKRLDKLIDELVSELMEERKEINI